MSTETLYRQVTMTQAMPPESGYPGGVKIEVAWIPSQFAKTGKVVTLDRLPGLWTVDIVYDTQVSGTWLRAQRGDWKRFDEVLTP